MHDGRPDVRLDTSLEWLLRRAPRDPSARVLATVVSTAGSTYRKPGARMLMLPNGDYLGLLSGGCLEADLQLHARAVLEHGVPRCIDYDMRGPDDLLFGIGAGCEGAMRVLLEPAASGSRAAAALAGAGESTQAGRGASLVIVHEATLLPLGTYAAHAAALPSSLANAAADALAAAKSRAVDFEENGRSARAFVQFLAPPPHLLLCGAGPDAAPVAAAALGLGWQVSVVDHRPAYTLAERFPGANLRLVKPHMVAAVVDLASCHAAVVMSHHLPSDVAYLRALAAADTPAYVGLLGPAARRRRIAEELGAQTERLRERLHGPVGIDIGAVTPEAIALAIVTQIHSWLAGRALT